MHRTSATIKIVCHGLYYILSGTDPESHPQASQVSTSLKIPEHTQHRETKHQKKARRDLLLPAAYPQGSAAHKPLSFRPPPQQDHPCSRRPSRTKTVVNLANTYRLALAPCPPDQVAGRSRQLLALQRGDRRAVLKEWLGQGPTGSVRRRRRASKVRRCRDELASRPSAPSRGVPVFLYRPRKAIFFLHWFWAKPNINLLDSPVIQTCNCGLCRKKSRPRF